MSSDIRFLQQADFPGYAVQLDWLLTDQNLIADGFDLQSAVIVALGTDALAPKEEDLPDPDSTDRRGWWGNLDAAEIWDGWEVGSLLWLLSRTKIQGIGARGGSTIAKAEGWTRDAINPLIDVQRRIASRIDVIPNYQATERIDVDVVIYRGPEPAITLRYAELWQELVEAR